MNPRNKTQLKQASEQHRNYEKGLFKESLSDDQPIIFPQIFRVKVGTKNMHLMLCCFLREM